MLSSAFVDDPFFSEILDRGQLMKNFFGSNRGKDLLPAMNVREEEKEFMVELAAPGLKKEDFNIILDNGILTVSAEKENRKEEEKEGFINREFSYDSFMRSVSIPESVDEDKEISAKYEDGVLKLKLFKKEGMETKKPKTIRVS